MMCIQNQSMFLNLSSELYTKNVHLEIVPIKCEVLLWMTHTYFFLDRAKNRAHEAAFILR